MAFGYPPKKSKTVLLKGKPEGFIFLAKIAFDNLGWYTIEDSEFLLRAHTPYSWMSEKDEVKIIVSKSQAFIESRYAGYGGGWDYGKNARNIKHLLNEIEKLERADLFV